jgi:hypothetical protein
MVMLCLLCVVQVKQTLGLLPTEEEKDFLGLGTFVTDVTRCIRQRVGRTLQKKKLLIYVQNASPSLSISLMLICSISHRKVGKLTRDRNEHLVLLD